MPCSAENRLYRAYRGAVKEWVASIKELNSTHSEAALQRIEESRICAMLAKEKYRSHIREHGCPKWASE
jgi:hypothetical protein